jgi:transposase, IS5 family
VRPGFFVFGRAHYEHGSGRGDGVIEARRRQRSFGDGLIAEEIEDLQETWMRHVDVVLQDEGIVSAVHETLAKRYPNSRRHGRPGYPAEVVLRLLILKHVRNWSYAVLEREVRANLVYRDFTRVGAGKMADAKTMGRWGVALGPAAVKQIHDRVVQIALARKVVQGRKMRIDTTVVESNIHYPTDSSLLGDGVRVLTRSMRKITALAGTIGTKLRDRSRSVKWRVLKIARAARAKAAPSRERLKAAYGSLLQATGRVVGQAKRFSQEIGDGVKRGVEVVQQMALEGHRRLLDMMVPRVQQVMRQTKARIYQGDTRSAGKIVSIFEPSAEVIRKGKAAKPTEFGKLVKLQEAENQIIIDYELYAQRPHDADLLIPRSKYMRQSWDASHACSQLMLGSIPVGTRPRQKPKVSSASAFPTMAPRVPAASMSRRSVGSATGSDGVPDARDASASASVGMDSSVAVIVATTACNAGSDSESSLTTSLTSADSSLPSAPHSRPLRICPV